MGAKEILEMKIRDRMSEFEIEKEECEREVSEWRKKHPATEYPHYIGEIANEARVLNNRIGELVWALETMSVTEKVDER